MFVYGKICTDMEQSANNLLIYNQMIGKLTN